MKTKGFMVLGIISVLMLCICIGYGFLFQGNHPNQITYLTAYEKLVQFITTKQ